MDEFNEKQAVSETQSVDTKKPKYNLMCVLSFIFGVMAVILGSFDNQSYFLYGACCLVSIIGIGFAFVGRINAYTTKTKGNKFAMTGLILSLAMLFGSVGYTIFNIVGRPTNFGIDSETDKKMIIVIGVSFAVAVVCAVISIVYYKISKKHK